MELFSDDRIKSTGQEPGELDYARAWVEARSRLIADVIEQGQTPLLPIEVRHVEAAFAVFVLEQEGLGAKLGEAMSQSSETWHDNAVADVINSDSVILTTRAREVLELRKDGIDVGYPSPFEDTITLGSIVSVVFGGGTPEDVVIVGGHRGGSTGFDLPGSPDVVTMSSPLGAALIGQNQLRQVKFKAPAGEVEVEICSIRQFNPVGEDIFTAGFREEYR